ncbi:MAG TPA: hypothetical protein VEV45_20750 [Streptosporangiaceae bacterium]|nr:hypothetical protein [Streptosporangiaceae bacterium]
MRADRVIEIRDPKYDDTNHEHEVVFTTVHSGALSNSNVEGLSTTELCVLYVRAEERLRSLGMSRPRMIKTAEMAEKEAAP